MFDRTQLAEAVEIHACAYRLILWVGKAVDRGILSFTSAHYYASDAEAAAAWIDAHYQNLPPESRPPQRDGAGLARFGNYFSSYVNTSFQLTPRPGLVLRSACGCSCWCCTYLGAAPHLETRKVSPSDKKRAGRLKEKYVAQLALDHGLRPGEARIASIVETEPTSEASALAAYAVGLLSRCDGVPASPGTHALWRQFAWEKAGSPKKGFVLAVDPILRAEAQLVRALREAS